MNNPLNYQLKETLFTSRDKQFRILKLINTQYNTEYAARVFTIIDPDREGSTKLEKVLQEAHSSMRASAHPHAACNYSYFRRNLKVTKRNR